VQNYLNSSYKEKGFSFWNSFRISRFLENMSVSKIDGPIEIQSHRIGNVFGIHRIEFTNADGTSTFQHIANSRNIFAKGALQAARWIDSRENGEYSFADFLNKKL